MEHSIILPVFIYLLLFACDVITSFTDCGGVKGRYVCDVSNPQAFHICLGEDKHSLVCPGTLHFNAQAQICDWPETTVCPYDNYSGLDENADEDAIDNDDNNIISNNFDIQSNLFHSALPETVDKVKDQNYWMRTNPYENWYKKKIFHDQNFVGDKQDTQSALFKISQPYDLQNAVKANVKKEHIQFLEHTKEFQNKADEMGEKVKPTQTRVTGDQNYPRMAAVEVENTPEEFLMRTKHQVNEKAPSKYILPNYGNLNFTTASSKNSPITFSKHNKFYSHVITTKDNGKYIGLNDGNSRFLSDKSYKEVDGDFETESVDNNNYIQNTGKSARSKKRNTANLYTRDIPIKAGNPIGDDKLEFQGGGDPSNQHGYPSQHDRRRDENNFINSDSSIKQSGDISIKHALKTDFPKVTRKLRKRKLRSRKSDYYFTRRSKSLSPYAPRSQTFKAHPYFQNHIEQNAIVKRPQASPKQMTSNHNTPSLQGSKYRRKLWHPRENIISGSNEMNNRKKTNVLSENAKSASNYDNMIYPPRPKELQSNNIVTSQMKKRTFPKWVHSYDENDFTDVNGQEKKQIKITDASSHGMSNNLKSKHSPNPRLTRVNSKRRRNNINDNVDDKRINKWFHQEMKQNRSIIPLIKESLYAALERRQSSTFKTEKSKIPTDRAPSIKITHTHPRSRTYRNLLVMDLVKNESFVPSNKRREHKAEMDVVEEGTHSKTKSVPAVLSVLGDTIHPYKPGRHMAGEAYRSKKYSGSGNLKVKMSWSQRRMKGKCSKTWCQLPNCRCVGSDIPGGLSRDQVPMMVMLTFDDAVNKVNFPFYKEVFDGSLRNPNGCPVRGTFFVSGDSTNYKLVTRLSQAGHEIASHTLTHRQPTTWWARAGVHNWEHEVVGMKNRLAEKANVSRNLIQGMRAPFLQVGGDDQYQMLQENNFRYDSSMVTGSLHKDSKRPPIWPFTLDTPPDYKTCNLTPCPTKSYPGLWELPLIRWYGTDRVACAMPDACYTGNGYKGTMSFLEDNYRRHYRYNKAPLGIFIHATWFQRKFHNFEALKDFLTDILARKDVWLLTASQVLDWIQEPVPVSSLDRIKSWNC